MNKVAHRILGPKWDEVTGGWGNVRNKKLPNFYSSPNTRPIKSRRMRWTEHVAHVEAKLQEVHTLFCRKTRRKEPLGRLICKWQDSIKMAHKEI
jgi:hypothetical protein